MSIVIERARSPRAAILACIAILSVALVTLWGYNSLQLSSSSSSTERSVESISAPGWTHAPWKLSAQRYAGTSRPAPQAIGSVQTLVTSLYDVMLLEPAAFHGAAAGAFLPQALRELERSKVGWPAEVADVRVRSRKVSIGIQAGRSDRAVAVVRLRASASTGGRSIGLWHRAHLWMERSDGRWRIFAFDIRQSPMR